MRNLVTGLAVLFAAVALPASASAQQPTPAPAPSTQTATPAASSSPWLVVPVFSSNPKLGTAIGALGAYLHTFDPDSRVSLFGVTYQYTSTHSQIAAAFVRTSFAADHQRLTVVAPFGHIKNDYDDYLGTGQPLKTDDDLRAVAARYLFRIAGDWFIGAQGNAANYQVLGADPEDQLVLETLGLRGIKSAALGAVVMHDSRDNEDMPTKGFYSNVNNFAYREALGGSSSYDAYRVDVRVFWTHGGGHVLAFRQYNWFTHEAPAAAQASVTLRSYKFGQYLAPYMSSLEVEERLSFGPRWGATLFTGTAGLYGEATLPLGRTFYPMFGAGVHFVLKPDARMIVNLEYAQGIEDNHGVYLKLGYAW